MTDTMRDLASEHARRLMTNGFNEIADRLVLMQCQRDLGGWCVHAVEDQLYDLVQAAVRAAAEECEKKVAHARYEGMMEAAGIADSHFIEDGESIDCQGCGETIAVAIRRRAEEVKS